MRAIVCGGSYWTTKITVFRVLDMVADEVYLSHVIVPMQYGIDRYVTQWGNSRRVPVTQVPISLEPDGMRPKGSGAQRRDDRMFAYGPGLLVAFGRGKGATRLVKRAAAEAVPYCIWDEQLGGLSWDGQSLQELERLKLMDEGD
jgi:hypothetical protein